MDSLRSPAPPPPPPPPALPSPPAAVRGERLRALHWEPLSAARVRGRRSVWAPRTPPPALDLPRLRLLFREPRGASPGQRPPPVAALLEPKRSIALGVLLKQLKRPVRQIVRDIEEGVGAPYGAELLLELSRLLPGAVEVSLGVGEPPAAPSDCPLPRPRPQVSRLRAFSGCPQQLPEPELFMLLLLEVPSYAQRLELMVLQEEFSPRLSALRASIQILADAAEEVVRCEELHAVLHLVLSAGNHLNAGGYAGSAAGFRLASLRRLPDTRANVPGVDLLHFVAMEAARTDRRLLDFPSKLPHVGPASRIEEAEVEAELRRLSARVAEARGAGAALCAALRPFVRAAEAELRAVRAERERMCGAAAAALDFYCEEAAPGALRELCAVLHGFAGRFLSAVQVTQPGPPSRRLSPPRSALTPSPRRRTAPGSSPSAGGSSSSCSGTSGAPSPRVRCGTRSPTDPADPSATLRRCSGGIRPRRCPSCGATPDPRGPRRSPPLRLPPPPRPPPASPRCSLDGGPAALPPRRRAAPRCSAFCGAWRAGRRAEPPRAESRRVLSSPVLLCDDNKCFGPPPGCGTYSAGSEVRDAV
ncbi:FH2 domain-containing protein 1-like isoform X2 [Gallus gallus]|uniref:FH2 domain-containing protein 1-like isoform X2 n=1 Tax=Gallus gallus TaxID=9031 RepID=UPI001AEA9804|nr:FH2 domain-containing protein 1-like isoform X2 [Gallus gallus]